MTDDDKVACAICGKVVTYARSRLFWSTDPENPGTFRTCSKGTLPHEKKR